MTVYVVPSPVTFVDAEDLYAEKAGCTPLVILPVLSTVNPLLIATFPVPDLMAVDEVVLVDPSVTVLTAPPVAKLTVVAEASVLIPNAPVPLLTVKAPLVEVTFKAPDPLCTVVADVELVEPKVEVLTAPPVAILTVVADASVEIDTVLVPEFKVIALLAAAIALFQLLLVAIISP